MIPVNYVAVIVAGIASMVLGFLWYGPLFGKTWMKLSGHNPKSMKKMMSPAKAMSIGFVLTLINAYVLAVFTGLLQITNVMGALQVAFWIWLGFNLPIIAGSWIWDGKPFKLFALLAIHRIIELAIMACIVALWI
jgi:hypothetical protein